ncbi:MAG: glutamate racemase [Chitinivibrionales bacterium]|nr:glutamate racemase [Chitinivibrionales bacterium]MBD3356035.1 glutamate racemase [Chitinivibrionales bacterium]
MSDSRPIGVFDSGLGGLTVVREIFRCMPGERVIYFGDTARVPYGGRSVSAIKRFGMQDARFLLSMDIKMLIVACNTVSSVGLAHIREGVTEIPVIGVVLPGSRAAALRTAERKIGVIGTRATVGSEAYTQALHNIDNGLRVYSKACPLFVPLVEEGLIDTDFTRMVAQHYLYELVDTGIDCLILGCTHYPLLMETILATVGTRVQLLDSAFWTAKEAADILSALGARHPEHGSGFAESRFFVSDKTPNFDQVARRFLGQEIQDIETIELEDIGE